MEDSQQKDYSFLGNDTFPSLYDAQVYERKFKSEYLERQFYVRLLKSEPSIEKLIENKARFKRRILLAPNRIAKLSACKMRRLNRLNATYFNSMRVSRIFFD